ncbi:class I SAM-dependent methyltransferase [bacterium]|nr:class I SAM-dependent methyltransferase [bacterium]
MNSLLNVGSGGHSALPRLQLNTDEWTETHFDVMDVGPGSVVGTILELDSYFPSQMFDVVVCSHMLEHIDPWNVSKVLNAMKRVIRRNGQVVVIVPDIEEAARAIVETHSAITEMYKTEDRTPITARDMIYGFDKAIQEDADAMRHRCGFTMNDLAAVALTSGLAILRLEKRVEALEIILVYR